MAECTFTDRLPVELRLRIYEYLLPDNEHLKLRQYIPGSHNLAILRTSRQIYEEAIPLLYDLNSIVVTRNDFCAHTDANLKTPLKLEYARFLYFFNFSQSIACTLAGSEGRCDVCQPSAAGLLDAFTAIPRLRAVWLDFGQSRSEYYLFQRWLDENGMEYEGMPYSTTTRGRRLGYQIVFTIKGREGEAAKGFKKLRESLD
ncbi:uncharacterized protein LTR77_005942 [Saxophila tyrrhenica]|uniref:F-box domain-containing protein n=1 Tax=Saxophila tyrrhenica TaxID=1690608 RepID=A0AAV9P7C9_9PEZI|nr:hypothetical protein LTR77_005942 [Saxophila tyrrhenica]